MSIAQKALVDKTEQPTADLLDIRLTDILKLDTGASVYLTKPVGFLYLKEAVEKAIGA